MRSALFTLAAATAALFASPVTGGSEADAVGKVDYWMKTMNGSVLNAARTSGRKFPLFNRWLSAVGAAVRSGMSPEHLVRSDPLAPVPKDVQALYAASDAARTELAPFTAPPPQTKDLQTLAAYQQQTEPRRMVKVLLTAFTGDQPGARAAAATYLSAHYRLPQ